MLKKTLHKTLLRRLQNILPAFLVIGMSLALYAISNGGLGSNHFQASHIDQADFRYIAEKFWSMDHVGYSTGYIRDWRHYLDAVPFREIGVGTYYLISAKIFQVLSGVQDVRPEMLSLWIPLSFILLLCGAYIFFYLSAEKKFGKAFALLLSLIHI